MKRLLPYLLLVSLAGCQTTQERPPMDWLSDGTTISEVSKRYGPPDLAGTTLDGSYAAAVYGEFTLLYFNNRLINQIKNKEDLTRDKAAAYVDPIKGILIPLVPVKGFTQ